MELQRRGTPPSYKPLPYKHLQPTPCNGQAIRNLKLRDASITRYPQRVYNIDHSIGYSTYKGQAMLSVLSPMCFEMFSVREIQVWDLNPCFRLQRDGILGQTR
jgi:hypothetical protein